MRRLDKEICKRDSANISNERIYRFVEVLKGQNDLLHSRIFELDKTVKTLVSRLSYLEEEKERLTSELQEAQVSKYVIHKSIGFKSDLITLSEKNDELCDEVDRLRFQLAVERHKNATLDR